MTARDGKPCKKCGTSDWNNSEKCRRCQRERHRRWAQDNPDKDMESVRRWQRANREKMAEYSRRWAQANPEKAKEASRSYFQKNPDKAAESSRRWRQENPEKIRQWKQANLDKNAANNQRRRTRKTKAGGSYTPGEWKELCNHYGNKCLRCGRDDVKLTADHIRPVSKGGHSNIDNIQPLCKPCNTAKNDRHIDYRPDAGIARWIQCKLFG